DSVVVVGHGPVGVAAQHVQDAAVVQAAGVGRRQVQAAIVVGHRLGEFLLFGVRNTAKVVGTSFVRRQPDDGTEGLDGAIVLGLAVPAAAPVQERLGVGGILAQHCIEDGNGLVILPLVYQGNASLELLGDVGRGQGNHDCSPSKVAPRRRKTFYTEA